MQYFEKYRLVPKNPQWTKQPNFKCKIKNPKQNWPHFQHQVPTAKNILILISFERSYTLNLPTFYAPIC